MKMPTCCGMMPKMKVIQGEYTTYGRLVCPKCGNGPMAGKMDKNTTREQERKWRKLHA